MEPRNLMRTVYDATLTPLDQSSPVDPAIYQVVRRMNAKVLNRLREVRMRDVEDVLENAFADLPNFRFQPNGKRKSPDMSFSRSLDWQPSIEPHDREVWTEIRPPAEWMTPEVMVEFKSAAKLTSKFQFNDSVPQGHIWYLFMSRREQRFMIMRGDVLLMCMSESRVKRVYNEVMRLRAEEKAAYGRRYRKGCDADGVPPASALYIATPRWNPGFTNFLKYAKGNGVFDMDKGTIWTPAH